jgi:serine/threonine protein kinase
LHAGRWQGRPIAIKTVLFQSSEEADKTILLAQEAATASSLMHRNVVATYTHEITQVPTSATALHVSQQWRRRSAAGQQNVPMQAARGCVYVFFLFQELCNGGSLEAALDAGVFGPQGLTRRWRPVMSVLRGVASGMMHMHAERIVHSNLKPSNVLFKVHF